LSIEFKNSSPNIQNRNVFELKAKIMSINQMSTAPDLPDKVVRRAIGVLVATVIILQVMQILQIARVITVINAVEITPQSLIGGFGALGTLLLAYATFRTIEQNERQVEATLETVKQNSEELEQIRIQREKDIAEQAVKEIIDPALAQLSKNKSRLNSGDIQWRANATSAHSSRSERSTAIEPAVDLNEVGIAVEDWLSRRNGGLVSQIKEYEQKINDLERASQQLAHKLRPCVQERLSESLADELIEAGVYDAEPDATEIVEAIINQKQWNVNHESLPQPHYTYQGRESVLYPTILNDTEMEACRELFEEHKKEIESVVESSEKLKQELIKTKRQIGREYDIVLD
jgi:hypothetical protein